MTFWYAIREVVSPGFHFQKRKVPFCLRLSANLKEDISLERLVDQRKRKGVQWVWGVFGGFLAECVGPDREVLWRGRRRRAAE